MKRLVRTFLWPALLGLLLVSCTGTNKSGLNQPRVVTLVERGVITETKNRAPLGIFTGNEFIWVNGVRYRVSGANITICGAERRSVEELRPGMVVRVRGYLDRTSRGGHATEIEF